MPSKSSKQARFMAAVAHNPDFAKEAGVPQSVGKEFHAEDKKKAKKTGKNPWKDWADGENSKEKKD